MKYECKKKAARYTSIRETNAGKKKTCQGTIGLDKSFNNTFGSKVFHLE